MPRLTGDNGMRIRQHPGRHDLASLERRRLRLALQEVDQVRERIFQAVETAAKTPVDAKRLDATKSNLRYSFAMSLDTAQSVASHLTRFIGVSGDPATINAAYDKVAKERGIN